MEDLATKVFEEFGVRLSGQAVCEYLKSKLNKSYKLIKTVPASRNTIETKMSRKALPSI